MSVSTSKPIRLILLALLAGSLAIVNGSASPATADRPSAGGSKDGPVTTITLITGDQVHVTKAQGGLQATAEPAPERTGIAFGIQRSGNSTWVYPSDAVGLIAAGRLDRRLFEVSALLDQGVADNASPTIPLIVQHSKGKPVAALPGGALRSRELASASSTVVKQDKRSANAFWKWLTGTTRSLPGQRFRPGGALAGDVRKVWLDGQVKASLDRSVPQVGAPTAWKKGYTGKGVKVAVLDTGIDATHRDLKGAVVAAKNFSPSADTKDRFGHGTHVASIITGDGARSGGKYKGVAPDAKLLNGKVLDDSGSGDESTVIAGMEWAVAQKAKVVNLSLGGWPNEGQDPVDLALNELSVSSGTLFVVAAGNGGPGRYTVTTPATATEALSVAATNRNQTTADFSSAGPRIGDFAVKPEIAAPGRDIVAARATGTQLGEKVGSYYVKLSGTSMATPHVAGAAAILAQQQPTWNARLLKSALMGTSRLPVNESVFRQGAGFVDVARAVNQKVFTLEGSVSANLLWPHTQKATRTITYRNPGSSPLTLKLAFGPKDQNGNSAAAGVFSLPNSVTVPARSTAKVTLTMDPAKSKPGLLYHGRITATATGIYVRTPVSVNVEPEIYEVSLDITDRNGNKVTGFDQGQLGMEPTLFDLANIGRFVPLRPRDGKWVARVPRSAYTIAQHVITPIPGGASSSTLYAVPRITATAPIALTFDAREGKRATAVVAADDARTNEITTMLVQGTGAGWNWWTGMLLTHPTLEPEAYVLPTVRTSRRYLFALTQELQASDRTYELLFANRGALPADPAYPVGDNELADLTLRLGAQGRPVTGLLEHLGSSPDPELPLGNENFYQLTLPTERRHLVTASVLGVQLEWTTRMEVVTGAEDFGYSEFLPSAGYQPGEVATVKLSTAAFTPAGGAQQSGPSSLSLSFSPFNSSGPGRIFDHSGQVSGDIVLERDGVRIGTSDFPFYIYTDKASGTATYTAIMHARRESPWSLYAPSVSGTWKFTSTAPESGEIVPPVISTRVSGAFDLMGRAPAGEVFPLTVGVAGAVGGVESVTVRVSYDEGKTWVTVPVSNASGEWVASVRHPALSANRWVALRVIATDTQGNSAGWTAYRSYQLAELG